MQSVVAGFVLVATVATGLFLYHSRDVQTDVADAEAERMAWGFMNAYGAASQVAAGAAAQGGAATTSIINTTSTNEKIMQATLHTNQGDITIEFMGEDAPNTVANFAKLAQEGFYNGTKFHRVIKGFMIQGGDPLSKDETMQSRWGTGGPGYQFADEIHSNNKNTIGTIAMANSGPNTNGSQFFINVADNNFLDGKHTVFGRVTTGMEIVTKIESVETGANDRPTNPIVIESISIQ